MPFETRVGVAGRVWKLNAGAELAVPSGRQASLGAGVEYWVTGFLGLRAGVAGIGGDGGMRITAGLTGMYKGINLDYALGTHELGISNRVAVSYAFWGSAQARPAIDWKSLRFKPKDAADESTEASAKAEEAAAKVETAAGKAAEESDRKPEPVESPREKPVAGGINLAVLDMTPQGVSASDASVITDMIRGELVKTGAVNVIEKQNMDKILAEQAFQQTGCTSEECAIKMGKLLNVQRIMVGSFGKLLDKYLVNVRVVNVETGKVVYADSAGGRTTDALEEQLKSLAERVARKLR
jgi:TolB-like protein